MTVGVAQDFDFNFPDGPRRITLSASTIVLAVVSLLVLFVGFTSFYTVPPDSQAVVMRFGKYHRTVDPGLRFKLPLGIDHPEIIPVERQLKQEFGFYTAGASNSSQYSASERERDAERIMVTGDLNAASVEWVIQFRITDPLQFLFEVRNPQFTLRDISESVMREVVGDRTVDEVITVGRQEIETEALLKMQELVGKYQLGLSINQVQLKDVNPPQPVQPSFNEVNQAQQQREQMINIANGEYNKVVPRAAGEAEQKIQEAEGYALKRVNEAEGDVANFSAVLREYLKAPEVTKRRLYLETMQQVIPRLGAKVILDKEASQVLPLLQLGLEGSKKETP